MTHPSLSKLSRFVSWISLVHSILFTAFWLSNNLFYSSTNNYLVNMVGMELDYVSILLLASILLAAWSGLRLAVSTPGSKHKLAVFTNWTFNTTAILYVVFFYGSFQLLFKESPVQLNRLGQMVAYFRIILDSVLLLVFVFFARRVLGKSLSKGSRKPWLLQAAGLVLFGILWVLALVFPPGSVVRGELPAKPKLIAHRGASVVAPENTIAAMQTATASDIYGLETDIHLSSDGQLFLMHDDTFKRTTNVRDLFPGRENNRVENFTISEVKQLDAGRWFIDQDPFVTIKHGLVSAKQLKIYHQQLVPTLAEMLDILRSTGQVFIFDLKRPPDGHPYNASFFDIALNQIQQAGIDPQVWFLVNEEQLQKLKTDAPEMIAVYGANYHAPPEAESLVSEGYQIVNVEYGISRKWIKSYLDAGLWVNIYTIDEPWQFSRLWVLGVDSITSSNALAIAALKWPVFGLPYGWYILIWSMIGLAGLFILEGRSLKGIRGIGRGQQLASQSRE